MKNKSYKRRLIFTLTALVFSTIIARPGATPASGAEIIEIPGQDFNTVSLSSAESLQGTIYIDGYDHGYEEGRSDGEHDYLLGTGDDERRAYQVNDPDSLYSSLDDPNCLEDEDANDRIGFPEDMIPVSDNSYPIYQKYVSMWREGYRDGYAYSLGQGAEEELYEKGHTFGYLDAKNDAYDPEKSHGEGDRKVRNGYYEPDFPDSLYNTLSGKYREAYRAGYDVGWKDGQGSFSYLINYNDKDFDPWRITTCPSEWTTAEKFAVETGKETVNAYYDVESDSFKTFYGDKIAGSIAAYSPYAYFFSDNDSYIYNGKKINRKEDALAQNVNAGIAPDEAFLYRTVSMNDGLYLLIRYRVGSLQYYHALDVKRYVYSRGEGDRSVLTRSSVIDHINNFYNSSEPVVTYDARKIVDSERKATKTGDVPKPNTKTKRREIEADAILIKWEEGKAAEMLGRVYVKAKAQNNVEASVSSSYIIMAGDPYINGEDIEKEYRFYKAAAREEFTDQETLKERLHTIAFAAPTFTEKLARKDGRVNNPFFTLHISRLDKAIKKYRKQINAALKREYFFFEIARLNIEGSRVVDDSDNSLFHPYTKTFTLHSAIGAKVASMTPRAPRRRNYPDYDSFMAAAAEYERRLAELREYLDSSSYKEEFRKELTNARDRYMSEYRGLVTRYGGRIAEFSKYLEKNVLKRYTPYTYEKKYSEGYFKDGNKDGRVTEIEQWEYDFLYGPDALNAPDHYNFNGAFDLGENIVPDPLAYGSDYTDGDLPDISSVPWLHGSQYNATTTVWMDSAPGTDLMDSFETSDSSDSLPTLNQSLYTQNADVRLSIEGLKPSKDKKTLRISPVLNYYIGETSDGEYKVLAKRSIKTHGNSKDLILENKSAAGEAVILMKGTNNLEGEIAVRMKSSGEAGFGIWKNEDENWID